MDSMGRKLAEIESISQQRDSGIISADVALVLTKGVYESMQKELGSVALVDADTRKVIARTEMNGGN